MASHHQHRGEVLPWPVDHAPKYRLETHRVVDAGPLACRPDLHEQLAEQSRRTELLRQIRREEIDHDLRVIGWGLLAGYLAVCIFQLARMLP